ALVLRVGRGGPADARAAVGRGPVGAVEVDVADAVAVVVADVVEGDVGNGDAVALRDAQALDRAIRVEVEERVLVVPLVAAQAGDVPGQDHAPVAGDVDVGDLHARLERLPGEDRGVLAHRVAHQLERPGRAAAGDRDFAVRGIVVVVAG